MEQLRVNNKINNDIIKIIDEQNRAKEFSKEE